MWYEYRIYRIYKIYRIYRVCRIFRFDRVYRIYVCPQIGLKTSCRRGTMDGWGVGSVFEARRERGRGRGT